MTSGYGAHSCSVTGHNSSRFGFESFAWWKRSCCLWSCHVLAKIRSENTRHPRKHYEWLIFLKPRVSPSTTIPFQSLGGNHQSAAVMLPGLWTPGARSLQMPPEPGNLSNKQAGFIREDKQVEVGISGRKHCIKVCSMSFDRFTHQFVSVSCLILHLINRSNRSWRLRSKPCLCSMCLAHVNLKVPQLCPQQFRCGDSAWLRADEAHHSWGFKLDRNGRRIS